MYVLPASFSDPLGSLPAAPNYFADSLYILDLSESHVRRDFFDHTYHLEAMRNPPGDSIAAAYIDFGRDFPSLFKAMLCINRFTCRAALIS